MNLAEFHIRLASEPATWNQRGRIMAECARLGLDDRAGRLAVCAVLAGLDELDSTRDLVMGDAGLIVRTLTEAASRDDLPAVRGEPDAPLPAAVPRCTWANAITAMVQAFAAIQNSAFKTTREATP